MLISAQIFILVISIHAPARGATSHFYSGFFYQKDFNPRSREGSDDNIVSEINQTAISIHAPARGATPPGFHISL